MGSVWLTSTADWLRGAGLNVVEYDGWTTRARSSGGYEPGRPLCIMWHHTASRTDPGSDAHYMCHNADARPVANVLIARDGVVWVLAAGATNTNGSGKSLTFSRGTVPKDSMNSYAFGMEIANTGTGEVYPQAQVDAAFLCSNTMNACLGNRPWDVSTHQFYAPDRKIDPAMGGYCVTGWHPRECTNAGSWNCGDLIDECNRRAFELEPEPEPEPEDDMANRALIISSGGGQYPGSVAVSDYDLTRKTFVSGEDAQALNATGQYDWITLSGAVFDAIPGAMFVDDVGN